MIRTSIVQMSRKRPALAAAKITEYPGWILFSAGQGVVLRACREFELVLYSI